MKTIRQVEIIPIFVDRIPPYESFKEREVYISKEFTVSVHRCLCGCGAKTVLPFDCIIDGKDLGWHLIEEKNGTVSFTPSVGNFQMPCKSHYIITKNIANFV
jgi:hypothetical protein